MKLKKFKFHKSLIICILLFMIISSVTIYSSMTYLSSSLGNLALKQLVWYLIGWIIVGIMIKVSNTKLYQYVWYIYITFFLLLFILLIIGQPINGSKCWFIIPGIGSIQPSEFMKIAIILTASIITGKWLENVKKTPTLKQELVLIAKVFGIWLIPSILTFL